MDKLKLMLSRYPGSVFRNVSTVRHILSFFAFLYALGFLITDRSTLPNFSALYDLMQPWAWGAAFAIYGLIKAVTATIRVSSCLKLISSVCGTWLWVYTVFSFIVYDTTPTSAAELMLILPVILELIELSVELWELKYKEELR